MYIDHDETVKEVKEILQFLLGKGYHTNIIGWSHESNNRNIRILRTRRFGDLEIKASTLLLPWTASRIHCFTRNQGQILCLAETESQSQADLRHARDFANAGTSLVCSSRARRGLEAGNLKGLNFRPTALMPRSQKRQLAGEVEEWSKYGEPWWQVWSDVALPWTAPSCIKRDPQTYTALPRETVNKFVFRDEGYSDHLWRYLRSELVPLGAFDIARTPEFYPFPWVIVSQRFHRVVHENGFECDFRPVFIDEDVNGG
jgi:hypothetical protein